MTEKPARKSSFNLSDRAYRLLEKLVKELDQVAIREDVKKLKKSKPDASKEELTKILMKRAALKTAAFGIAAGASGTPVAILAMAPDIFNLVREQSKLILSIAFIYGHKPDVEERFKEVLAVLAVATGASAARTGVRMVLQKGLEETLAQKIMKRLLGRIVARRIPRIVPIIGGVVGGAINVAAVAGVHKAAVEYYKDLESDTEKT